MWGKVERISPEAPVPVVSLERKEYRIGGAGNVALNCQSLGAQVSVLSVIGDDTEGLILQDLFTKSHINTHYMVKSGERITTNKTRIISRNQHMMRLDAEVTKDINDAEEKALLQQAEAFIAAVQPQVIIFEDYNKGVLTPSLIQQLIALCTKAGVITAVDPKRKNFFTYQGVDIFKPNLKEVKEGLNLLLEDVTKPHMENIHLELTKLLHHKISFITLSEHGVFYQQGDKAELIASHLRSIADVSGAGDTVIAVASLVFAATGDVQLMAEVANIAGGLVCEEVGTVAISRQKLLHECELLLN
jgi:rfaE bifunctional protein kinase chain/domain